MSFAWARRIAAALLALSNAIVGTAPAAAAGSPKHYRIGIIGSGKVGGTLGLIWAKAGNEILFSSRHPNELKTLALRAGPRTKVGTPAEAAGFGEVVLIAVPYSVFPEVARANAAAMKGKVVFDVTNALAGRDGPIVKSVRAKGIGAYSASLLPGAHLVRGFNAIGYHSIAAGAFRKGERIAIPLASDDPKAIAVGSDLVRQAGFVPIVVPLRRAGDFGPGAPLGTGDYTAAEWKRRLGLR